MGSGTSLVTKTTVLHLQTFTLLLRQSRASAHGLTEAAADTTRKAKRSRGQGGQRDRESETHRQRTGKADGKSLGRHREDLNGAVRLGLSTNRTCQHAGLQTGPERQRATDRGGLVGATRKHSVERQACGLPSSPAGGASTLEAPWDVGGGTHCNDTRCATLCPSLRHALWTLRMPVITTRESERSRSAQVQNALTVEVPSHFNALPLLRLHCDLASCSL